MLMVYSQAYTVMIVIIVMTVINIHIVKTAIHMILNMVNIFGQKKRGINMQIKYELCNLETLEGIERAEQLKDDGWTTCESSPFSVMMKKEDTNG